MGMNQLFNRYVERLRHQDIPVRVRLWSGAEMALGASPSVTIGVPDPASLRFLVKPSLERLGEAYVEGKLDVQGRIMDIIDVAARLADADNRIDARWLPRLNLFGHTRRRDADAIAYHYDVSNEFYALWLDSQMVYSCGYFHSPTDTLEAAQVQKIDHILTKLRIQPGDRLLDIGCGWGALVMRAAEKFGAKATGITLSRNQCELAQERIARAGLNDRCEVRIEDYRDAAGTYDRIASVGMFEHVGLKNLRLYFARIRSLLADNGAALNHGITSTDAGDGQSYAAGGDFIDRYVFPDGELAHIGLVLREMCAAGLEPVDVENLRRHYAITLRHWAERFEKAGERLRDIAGEKRYRIWRAYLAGCAYGFAHNWVALHQVLAVKAGADALPLTRNYMYR